MQTACSAECRGVDRDAVAPQQDVQPPIAEPPALLRQLAQSRPQVVIIRPPLAHPPRRLEMRDRFALGGGRCHFSVSRSF